MNNMSNERVLATILVLFTSAVGYQLMGSGTPPSTPPDARVVPTGSPSAYGPTLVDPVVSHDEVLCMSWTECIDSCKKSDPTRGCYESCNVTTLNERRSCEAHGECACDVNEKTCYTFCNADPT
jgi:hypothetical protein